MKSIEERLEEIREDPVKLKRVFTIIWVAAYSMLIIGAILIVVVLLQGLQNRAFGPGSPSDSCRFVWMVCYTDSRLRFDMIQVIDC